MASKRATAFVSSITSIPPFLLFLFIQYFQRLPHLPVICIIGIGYAFILSKITIPFFFSPLRHLPEPEGDHAVFGHFGALLSRPHGVRFLNWMRTVPNEGFIHFRGIFQMRSRLLLTTPETVHEVLSTHSYDFVKQKGSRKFLSRSLGRGLIVVEGKEHKMQRKSVTPAFHGKHIRDLVPTFWGKANELCDVMAKELTPQRDGSKYGTVEINHMAKRITLDIIGLAGLGRDFKTLYNNEDELAQQYEIVGNPDRGNLIVYFLVNVLMPPKLVQWLPWKRHQVFSRMQNKLREICGRLVEEKKIAMEKEERDHIDILSVLMKSGNFEEAGYVDQLLTFLAAGHETTSNALTWACWLLAIHPEVQEKVRAEVRQIIPADRTQLDATHLDQMHYTSAVCNEVLRLYPTVPTTARECARTLTIQNQVIPAGTGVIISPWAINRSKAIWGPDADKFVPERWLDDKSAANGNPYNFITFLHGPRSCIGQGFARSEMRALLAAVVDRFEMTKENPTEEIVPVGLITIKPKNGMKLQMKDLKA